MTGDLTISPRTKIGRLSERQVVDRAALNEILDQAVLAHVAVVRDGMPVVIPFACARDGNSLLLHGSTGSGLMREAAEGQPVSVAVTHVDGIVVARSVFDNSMNYRSVVAFGMPEVLEGDDKNRALHTLTDHLLPGRWDEVRPNSRKEIAATLVLRLPLDEVSVKVRAAAASSEPDDGENRGVWAGVLPMTVWAAEPVTNGDVPDGVPVPRSVQAAQARIRRHSNNIEESTKGYMDRGGDRDPAAAP
jgi:nitroimidazol reductase NimA-like FMN-containing flavoprotein (pyridoxamine 5'-phosphate oxidase superfamily)